MQDRKFTDISTALTPARPKEETPRPVPALTLISHPTPQRAGEQLLLAELARGESVAVSRVSPDFVRPGGSQGMPLADLFLSRKPLVFQPAPHGGVRLRLEEGGMRVHVGEELLTGSREFSPEEVARGIPLVL